MKHGLVAFCFFFLLGAGGLQAQGPDAKYVIIYNMIQEADALKGRDRLPQAAERYLEAMAMLRVYPTEYPGWNEKVVSYRLDYLSAQLKTLSPHLPAAPQTNTVATPAEPLQEVPAPVSTSAMQDEIARLTQNNADLEAKLKEALSVQPADVDPRELAKSEQKIEALQKQIDLLKVSLEQEKSKPPFQVQAPPSEQEKLLIGDLKERLLRQNELVENLKLENQMLKTQLEVARTSLPDLGDANKIADELLITKATVYALQATNIALKTQQILLESRIKDLTQEATGVTSEKVTVLMKERDDLLEKLGIAQRQLEQKRAASALWNTDDLAGQLESALAKLDVYEARQVPYTPTELAFFKKGDEKVENQPGDPDKIKIPDLPPGTGPLFAEARIATDSGRFDQAEQIYLQVLRQDENHVLTLNSLAAVQMEQNRLEDAEQTLKKALLVNAKDPATLYLFGRLKYTQGSYDAALEALSLSAKIIPDDPRTQYFLGKTLLQKSQPKTAETALRKAVQLRPGWAEAHHSLAWVYATQKPPFKELAQWHYLKARDGTPPYPADLELEKLLEDTEEETAENP